MSAKEKLKTNEQETALQEPHRKKEIRRYTGENKKVTAKLNEQTEIQKAHGKKTRRNFRHAPTRE